ncbi:unnamed protein product [Symbiodinium sp. KB8]|nr:unnamed protein product [Symbiodinium sp. KB8]
MGIFDDRHFTIAHKDGKTSEILTSDGAVHASFPSSVFHTWNRPLGYPSGIAFGHEFIQMGNWRVAAMDDHLSISHKDGQTPKFYSSTGHITHGPTTAHNAWSRPIGPASGVTFGDRFIQIGKFRIGDADGLHLATTYLSGVPGGTPLFLHAHWGWCGTINKHVHLAFGWYGPTVNARHAHWHCGSLQANMGSCPGIVTGDDFMQIGQWRLAADGATFSVSHIDGQAKTFSAASLLQTNESLAEATASTTASLLQANDSLMVAGVWSRQPMAAASNKRVQFGDRVIQIGQWRLGDVDGNHFSISHSSLKTLVIYRSNSADDPHPVHEGARPEWGMWGGLASRNPPMDQSMGVSFGDRFIQIGNFRLGDVDGKHFSVAHAGTGKTLMVFQSDGHHGHHHCPRDDFTTLGRRMEQCQDALDTRHGREVHAGKDDLSLENVNESLSNALVLRSSRVSEESNFSNQDLDAVVSAKIFHDIGDGLAKVGNTLKAVGMKAGEAAGNAAMVVGNHVIEAAKAKLDLLPFDVKQLANQLGGIAKGMANGIKDFGKTLEKGVVNLADDALKHAQHFAEQGATLATRVGDKIATEVASKARWLGDKVKTLGPLVAGLASAAWEQIKKFVNCLDDNGLMCPILIGDRCVIGKSAGFGMGYGFKAKSGGKFGGKKAGKLQLPGQIFEEKKAEAKQSFKKKKGGLKNKMSGAPSGSCETSIDMAIEGHVQNALIIGMHTNGPFTTIDISGGVGVSLDGMIKAQGSCTLTAEKRFPKVPKKKVICYKAFCIVLFLQMVAQLEITGALTGTLELGAEVGFDIEGKITVDKATGEATAEFKAPSVDRQAAFAMGASAFASIRLGAGPFIVVYPVPGVPVNFNPMVNLEVRAQGDIKFGPVGVALIQEPDLEPTNSSVSMLEGSEADEDAVSSSISSGSPKMLKMCAAAALNIYIDSGITAFGIPVEFDIDFRPQEIAAEILQSYVAGALAAYKVLAAGMACVPGLNKVSGVVMSTLENVAREAAKKVTDMIPDLNIDFSGKPVALAVDKVYCVEAYTTPGFSTASCAEELGCSHVGRKPSSDAEVTRILPQKKKPSHELLHTRQLVHKLGLGDHFLELGNFRLAAMDYHHFSISHCTGNKAHTYYWPILNSGRRRGVTSEANWPACQKRCSNVWNCVHFTFYPNGGCRLHTSAAKPYTSGFNGIAGPKRTENHNCRTIQIWHADGRNFYGPTLDWGAWHKSRTPNAHASAIKFGFEFIEIGHFRLGAADDEHFSLSHSNGNTLEIFKDDGYIDGNRRTDYGTWDRPVGKPLGISFGDRFLQLGNFRIGDEDNMRFVISSVKKRRSIQVFDGHDGKTKGNQWSHYTSFLNRLPADYTVKGIGETSFGACDPQFAAWGDRFIQLGDWRMGAYDDHHFTFSHKDGRTAEILTSDGVQHRHHPSSSFGTWHRSLGFPSGIVFGHQFIQFGNWRVAAIDDRHLSISHRRGKTAKLFQLHHHPHLHWGFTGGLTTYSAWGRRIGPASGVNFGDKFIQIGNFRIGDSNGMNLAITFAPWGNSLYRFHKDGWADTDHHGSYGPAVNSRPTHWHCGSLQEAMGSCTGIVTGEDFMQIGDWRLAAEGDTFSVSHIDGQAQIPREPNTP